MQPMPPIDDAPPSKKRKRARAQESPKAAWMITYTAMSPDITREMLAQVTIECDECYTIAWRESKYTLIHLRQSHKIRGTAFSKIMTRLHDEFRVQGSSIVGYETLMPNKHDEFAISEHPAFKRMVELINTDRPFYAWIEKGEVRSYRRGLFWKHIKGIGPEQKTHAQLVAQIRQWAPIVQEVDALRDENRIHRSVHRLDADEKTRLEQKCAALTLECQQLRDRLREKGA